MSECAATQPWPCGQPVAGGTHPLGAELCPRHLAGVLAPPVAPNLDRTSLRVRTTRADWTNAPAGNSHARAVDPETLAAIIALAPLGATVYRELPRYERQDRLSAPYSPRGARARSTHQDDPAVPRSARTAIRKAAAGGWHTRIAVVDDLLDEHVLVRAHRDDQRIALTWTNGAHTSGWLLGRGQLEPIGYRVACTLLATPCMHTQSQGVIC